MPTPSHAAGATAKVEKIRRPTFDEGISLEDWLYFEQRWQEYKDATRVAGLDVIYQLLDCCNPDGLRNNLVRVHRDTLAFCNECELLANIKKLAVRTENAMVARDILSKMRPTETNPSVLTALDLRGRREFANSPPGVSVRTALTTTHALEWITATLWYKSRQFWAAPITI